MLNTKSGNGEKKLTFSSPNHQEAGQPTKLWKIIYKYDRNANSELQDALRMIIDSYILTSKPCKLLDIFR